MRCWNARKGPRMGPNVHEVDTARSSKQGLSGAQRLFVASAGAQTKVDEEVSPNPAEFAQKSHK